MKKKQQLSKRFNQYSTQELMELLDSPSVIYRAHAVETLARRPGDDEAIGKRLLEVATKAKNRNDRLIGTVSIAHIAIASLLETGSHTMKENIKKLLDDWPEPDRSDLIWYLTNKNLSIDD